MHVYYLKIKELLWRILSCGIFVDPDYARVGSKVLTVMVMMCSILWNIHQRWICEVEVSHSDSCEVFYLLAYSLILNMEATYASETSVGFPRTTPRMIYSCSLTRQLYVLSLYAVAPVNKWGIVAYFCSAGSSVTALIIYIYIYIYIYIIFNLWMLSKGGNWSLKPRIWCRV
jgi:hypothetical protein